MNIIRETSTDSSKLERWLGADEVQRLSDAMANWYGPPIAVAGVPGEVFAHRGGDFRGKIRAGFEVTAQDRAQDMLKRIKRGIRVATRANQAKFHTGFSSLSDLISEATAGKRTDYIFSKTSNTAGAIGGCYSTWKSAGYPSAGAAGSAAPGGRACDDSLAGAWTFANPASGDTQHFVSGFPVASLPTTLLLYDRIFDVAKTMNSTAAENVTGVPTRYQNTTNGQPDSVAGNFLTVETFTTLAATAHNWTGTYTDETGATGNVIPSFAGVATCPADRLDYTALGQWFVPLAANDLGVKNLTQMTCGALVATGAINFVIGHPLAWMPCPIANVVCQVDGINSAFNLTRIFDDACMSFLEVSRSTTGTPTYTGSFTTVAG